MADITTDEEQVEQLKQWWSDNGRFVVSGIVLGVVLVSGWRYWQGQKVAKAQSASETLHALHKAVDADQFEEVEAAAKRLATDYASTPYDELGLLALAKTQVEQDQLDAAAATLEQVRAAADDPDVKTIATLRLARVYNALAKPEAAIKLFANPPADAFSAEVSEVLGDAYQLSSQYDLAKQSYQTALAAVADVDYQRATMLEMKLAELANLIAAERLPEAPLVLSAEQPVEPAQ